LVFAIGKILGALFANGTFKYGIVIAKFTHLSAEFANSMVRMRLFQRRSRKVHVRLQKVDPIAIIRKIISPAIGLPVN
jgi:hypothetical protein